MTRQPKKRRKAPEATPDDAFIARILAVSVWAKRHARPLMTGGIIFAVLLAAGLYYRHSQRLFETHAVSRLMEVEQAIATGNIPLAIRDLEQYLQQFGGTKPASQARVSLGKLYLKDDEPDKAIEVLSPLAERRRDPMATSAAFLLAAAYEEKDQVDEAEDVYLIIADQARFKSDRRRALDEAGRIRMDQADARTAVTYFERALDMTPDDSGDYQFFIMRLAEARAMAAAQGHRTRN